MHACRLAGSTCICDTVRGKIRVHSNRDFGLRNFQLLLGKSVWIRERLKMQSGEESSSSGRFNPVGRLQQSGCLGSYPP